MGVREPMYYGYGGKYTMINMNAYWKQLEEEYTKQYEYEQQLINKQIYNMVMQELNERIEYVNTIVMNELPYSSKYDAQEYKEEDKIEEVQYVEYIPIKIIEEYKENEECIENEESVSEHVVIPLVQHDTNSYIYPIPYITSNSSIRSYHRPKNNNDDTHSITSELHRTRSNHRRYGKSHVNSSSASSDHAPYTNMNHNSGNGSHSGAITSNSHATNAGAVDTALDNNADSTDADFIISHLPQPFFHSSKLNSIKNYDSYAINWHIELIYYIVVNIAINFSSSSSNSTFSTHPVSVDMHMYAIGIT